jgi:hypothetical protein
VRLLALLLLLASCSRSHEVAADASSGQRAACAGSVKPEYGDLGRVDGKAERSATGNLFFTTHLPADGGEHPDFLSVELYHVGAGTYDLAKSTDYQSCKACVLVLADQDPDHPEQPPAAYFLATEGTLTVTTDGLKLAGTLAGLKLERVTIDSDGEAPTYATSAQKGAGCTPESTTISAASFDAVL